MIAMLGVVACTGSGANDAQGASSASAARLASVLVASSTVLSAADVAAANAIGLDLVTLEAPLRTWWSTLNDPAVAASTWLGDAPALLDAMSATVDHVDQQLGVGRAPEVRETYGPYVEHWRIVLRSLAALRDAVAADDLTAEQHATSAYNGEIATMRQLDRGRVARVVDVYGHAEATRALKAQGLDPTTFGL